MTMAEDTKLYLPSYLATYLTTYYFEIKLIGKMTMSI